MTPLDDELRRTLQSQAGALAPSPDPLSGIEQRARRIRRRRTAGAALTAAAAVAAVALVVPAVVSNDPTGTPNRLASASPSTSPSVSPVLAWDYRGDAIPQGTLDTYQREWAVRHPGSTLVPLFGQVYEPSATQELVFAAEAADGVTAGVIRSTESGPEVVYDVPLGTRQVLAFVLPGDEVGRVLAVASPSTKSLAYTDDVANEPYETLASLAPGVGTGPVRSDRPGMQVRATAADGSTESVEPYDHVAAPSNLLDWPARGDASAGPSTPDLEVAFSRENGRTDGAAVRYRPLFTGDTDSGVRFTLGQAWFDGDEAATTVLYSVTGSQRGVLRQYGTPDGLGVVAGLLTDLPGTSVDFLVVVPTPGTGQVLYDDDAVGAFRPVIGQDHLDGVVLVDRAKDAAGDRLQLLDGNGDLDKPLWQGAVADLLAPVR